MTRQEQIATELEQIATELREHEREMASLYQLRLALWTEGQNLDPKMTQAALAIPSGVSEAAVTKALRQVRLAAV
jgi:hypothetical protein